MVGSVLVVEVRLSVNLMNRTIEEVRARGILQRMSAAGALRGGRGSARGRNDLGLNG